MVIRIEKGAPFILSSVVNQSRIVAWMYGSLGLFGVLGFFEGISLWVVIGVALPLLIGITEGGLGWKYAHSGRLIWVKLLFWHQFWTWGLCMGCLFLLRSIEIEAYVHLIPRAIWERLVDQVSQVGIDPIAYLEWSWRFALFLVGILFTAKIIYLAWNYRKWARKLKVD